MQLLKDVPEMGVWQLLWLVWVRKDWLKPGGIAQGPEGHSVLGGEMASSASCRREVFRLWGKARRPLDRHGECPGRRTGPGQAEDGSGETALRAGHGSGCGRASGNQC
jgi:hypothetical protein